MKMKVTMMKAVCLMGVIPILLLTVVTLTYNSSKFESTVHKEIRDKLEVSANALLQHVISEYGDAGIEEFDYDYIDALAEMGIELTLIQDNVRRATTIRNLDGTRNEGSRIDGEIYSVLKQGEAYYSDDVSIGGNRFAVYYLPILSNGQYVGAVFSGQSVESITEEVNQLTRNSISLTLGVVIISLIILCLISRAISKPLELAAKELTSIAAGDLTSDAKLSAIIEETKNIMFATSELRARLSSIVTNVHQDIQKLDEGNREFSQKFKDIQENINCINIVVEEIALGATSQAQDTVKTSEHIAVMSSDIVSNGRQIELLDSTVQQMSSSADVAVNLVKNLEQLNSRNTSSIETFRGQIAATSNSVEKIHAAVEIIQGIAKQTNLLSLNASIEAARAGEAGRGFAVVADEIRKLASNSAQSAEEIEGIVTELASNATESVSTTQNVLSDIKKEREALLAVESAFEDLGRNVTQVTQISGNIAEQMVDIESARSVIAEVTENLTTTAEESAASTEETCAAMQELNAVVESCVTEVQELVEMSNDLADAVSIFRV